ncbi:MAG: winged helix-turn-helix transcriptional regulator [Anaerolineales bacterium]|nr:winged helix-turn-helix transcriptional regulator [Anaerolineales bacterium]
MSFDNHHELQLMDAVAAQPETSQAALAEQLGIAVGTVNWYLKKWSKKGYVKVSRVSRWRWHYLLTPQGLAEKSRLTRKYIDASLTLFRRIRQEAQTLIQEVEAAGFNSLVITGDTELADICRLTCLERKMTVAKAVSSQLPVLVAESLQLQLIWPSQTQLQISGDQSE